MRRKISVVGYVPARGGYVPLDDLTDAGRAMLSRQLVDRLGAALSPYVSKMRGDEDGLADWSPAKAQ